MDTPLGIAAFIVPLSIGLMIGIPNSGAAELASWPVPVAFAPNFPAQGEGPVYAARFIGQMSDGKWVLKPLESNEVAAEAITDAVRTGRFNAGFAWLSADASRIPAADLIASRPFGMEPLSHRTQALTMRTFLPAEIFLVFNPRLTHSLSTVV